MNDYAYVEEIDEDHVRVWPLTDPGVAADRFGTHVEWRRSPDAKGRLHTRNRNVPRV